MSLHLGVVSIEGNRLLELAEVLRKDGYLIDQETTVDTSREAVAAAEEQPDRLHVTKVAYSEDDFTHLLDLEMVLQHNDVWLEYSRKWVCRVIGWICEGASSTFQLSVCDRGEWIRHVVVVEGEVRTSTGEPLEEKEWLEWLEADEESVLAIVDRLGATSDFSVDRQYRVYRLNESQM